MSLTYRSRGVAYEALWRLSKLHYERDNKHGQCVCGRSIVACKEMRAMDRVSYALEHWEAKQIDRAARGLDNKLPRDHPSYVQH